MLLKKRSEELEVMDGYQGDAWQVHGTLSNIEIVNRFLGGSRVLIHYLEKFSKTWPAGKTIRILDVGCGSSDIPKAVIDWARRKKLSLKITALDILHDAVTFSRKRLSGYPEINYVQADALKPPFRPEAFDYVFGSMFFHHLSDELILEMLASFNNLAGRGIIVNDLLRRLRAYLMIFLISRFSRVHMFRIDAPLSVLKGFKRPELEDYIEKSGLSYLKFRPHFLWRFALAGEKPFNK